MASEATAGRKVLEFFSAKNLADNPPQHQSLMSTDRPVSYRQEGDQQIYMEANALILENQRSADFAFEGSDLHFHVFELAAGVLTPLHSHYADCLYYVERGSVVMGRRRTAAGANHFACVRQVLRSTFPGDQRR